MATSRSFSAPIGLVDINPFVEVPGRVVTALLADAGKRAGPIPVAGTLAGAPFRATVVRFRGLWRLYLNGTMRAAAGVDVGDRARVTLRFDAEPRVEPVPAPLARALARDPTARAAFAKLAPSHRRETLRYLNNCKRPETLARNVAKVIGHLRGRTVDGMVAVTRSR